MSNNVPPPPGGYGFPNAPKDPSPPPAPPVMPFTPAPSVRRVGTGRGARIGFPIAGVAILSVRLLLVCARAGSPSYSYDPPPIPSTLYQLPTVPSATTDDHPLAPAADMPASGAVATDATSVYWTDPSQAMVLKRPKEKDGLTARTLLATDQDGVSALALGADAVYFTLRGTSSAAFSDGALVTVPKSGGPARVLAGGLAQPLAVAVDGGEAYVLLAGTPSSGGGEIVSVDLDDDEHAVTVLATEQLEPTALAIDKTHVYWTNRLGGAVMRVRRTASGGGGTVGDPETFAKAMDPEHLALDGDTVYWTATVAAAKPEDEDSVRVFGKSKRAPGSGPAAVLSPKAEEDQPLAIGALAPADGAVFFTRYDPLSNKASLYRVPKNGSGKKDKGATLVKADVTRSANVAADGKTLWWASDDGVTSLTR